MAERGDSSNVVPRNYLGNLHFGDNSLCLYGLQAIPFLGSSFYSFPNSPRIPTKRYQRYHVSRHFVIAAEVGSVITAPFLSTGIVGS